ncbi:MAG TPA: LolA-related protein [Burkholderiales bacterium]|nr:LolA-related protein [Burkholderiales bacterium]
MILRQFFLSALLATGILLGAQAAVAADWDIDQLMQALAQVRNSHAAFSETKTMALLDKPQVSSGELIYKAPDYFEKRTLRPQAETLILNGDTVLIARGQKHYLLKLADYPEIAAFTASLRGTLAGDRQMLQRSYALSLEGSKAHWKLRLLPTDSRIKDRIARIVIGGVNNELRSIEIIQTDGDSSITTIADPAP